MEQNDSQQTSVYEISSLVTLLQFDDIPISAKDGQKYDTLY
jgi:hypothetical protein